MKSDLPPGGFYAFEMSEIYPGVDEQLVTDNVSWELKKAKDFNSRRIVKIWNALPAEIINIIPTNNSIIPFKRKLKEFYFNKLENTFNPYVLCTWRTFCQCAHCRE